MNLERHWIASRTRKDNQNDSFVIQSNEPPRGKPCPHSATAPYRRGIAGASHRIILKTEGFQTFLQGSPWQADGVYASQIKNKKATASLFLIKLIEFLLDPYWQVIALIFARVRGPTYPVGVNPIEAW